MSSQARGRFRLDFLLHALPLSLVGNCDSRRANCNKLPKELQRCVVLLCLLLVGAASAKLAPPSGQLHQPAALSKVSKGGATKKRPASEQLTPSETPCGNQPVGRVHDNSSLSHFAATTQPCRA